ncbi:hypothetical protein QWY93_17050 [Echinicola jeungdonensis]|uniref:Uncharacterized protein n=1 Tax=Echinicola jeungdonensis TaxID=709343 RepID=A0ABV5J5M8_9BACT|nr:hypothetical protein [Echinicola jeungdonensis]MDN3671024.1 hypothetical protein [Echinicola jeungdonensis]
MWIRSIHGAISVVHATQSPDHLFIKAKNKAELSRLFDEHRIMVDEGDQLKYGISICKQEFADTLIKMIKEIDYYDFNLEILKLNSHLNSSMA